MENATRSNQIIKISRIFSGISVLVRQGSIPEKNNTSEMQTTAMIKRLVSAESLHNIAGRNISAIDVEAAFAASMASGVPNILKKG